MPDPLTVLVIATGHALSLALIAGDEVLAQHHAPAVRGHDRALVPALDRLLAGHPRPGAVAVEVGPGSFTGVRVGVAAARALALAWDVPVWGLTSTALVAAEAALRGHRGSLLVALAAPRGQLWLQAFDDLAPQEAPRALEPCEARSVVAGFAGAVTGSGLALLGLEAPEREPRAAAARALGPAHRLPPFPIYVRPRALAA
ncbi:MAG: tRNA (adenosine(37)-N6)-threonylcarbamoyltransferase complex dimerization subunit type 1 TsaB [Sphingomonadaceae bacterium]|uniref:tRNA (adenosine(37)-N6)-threonylcarbamoyltransferase complex dimerization subunit type 1 TsaB n=1 Tax=Thermaurantiacus sp. TaxID=2820283 RepID=UPI00298EE8B9|nr:tRNA (adenosine(37)-N6)-threonylcarbamoyltransferase complex dimerization subunit type 1 TsaB [Thermaurantiacus sp.]MCS6985921.1 tRNA (adenosine(37)-N6)-threonylcarbamoyltransferase complex dimerization subunit type 1 TsaB [Sphingomonadaceae bacterium]MDW8414863.1 tRNA (adenosine(37)-N6)-threonylcarbamoyltransferase complex dimerization subunit type 1 TsaB [Thermaurantiacus sp.]